MDVASDECRCRECGASWRIWMAPVEKDSREQLVTASKFFTIAADMKGCKQAHRLSGFLVPEIVKCQIASLF